MSATNVDVAGDATRRDDAKRADERTGSLPTDKKPAARGLWETICLGALGGIRPSERPAFKEAVRRALSRDILRHQAIRLCLSSAILTLLVLEVMCGISMMVHYVPTLSDAYDSVREIDQSLKGGWFLRNFHVWNGRILALLLGLSLVRMIYAADYKDRGRSKWSAAVLMLVMILMFQATGIALTRSATSVAATEKLAGALGDFPLIGGPLKAFLVDPSGNAQRPLTRAFIAHVAVMPWIAFFLVLIVHSTRTRQLSVPLNGEGDAVGVRPLWPDRMLEAAATSFVCIGAVAGLAIAFPSTLGAPPANERVAAVVDPILRIFTAAADMAPGGSGVMSGPALGLTALLAIAAIFYFLAFVDRGNDRSPRRRIRVVAVSILIFAAFAALAVFGGKR